MKICRWCSRNLNGVPDDAQNWYCRACWRFDASECFRCRTTAGFPRTTEQVTAETAQRSPVWAKANAKVGVDNRPLDERIARVSLVYCPLCFHNMYFVAQNGQTSRCLICETEWDRLGPAAHTGV